MLIILFLILSVLALIATVYLLGFRLGSGHADAELVQIRLSAAQAERDMHSLTRQAFVAMAEEAMTAGDRP